MQYGYEPDRGLYGPPASPTVTGSAFVVSAYAVLLSAGWFAVANEDGGFSVILPWFGAVFLAPVLAAVLLAVGLPRLVRDREPTDPMRLAAWGLTLPAVGIEIAVIALLAGSWLVLLGAVVVAVGLPILVVATARRLGTGDDASRGLATVFLVGVLLVSAVGLVDGVSAAFRTVTTDVEYQTSEPSWFGGYVWASRPYECGTLVDDAELLGAPHDASTQGEACAVAFTTQAQRVVSEVLVFGTTAATALVLLCRAALRASLRPLLHRRRDDRRPTRTSSRRRPATG